jgi:alpha-galactosidase
MTPLKSRLSTLASIAALLFAHTSFSARAADPNFWSWADAPVMGWNSWDFYGTSINEERTKAQADYMASNLLAHGWSVFTVDIQWYQPTATGFNYINGAALTMDEWGRLTPATNRFPSAMGGAGFKPLADYLHAKGLKFGIHMMRGIPRQAYAQNTPVKGTAYTANQIGNPSDTCSWNPDMYGVDMTKPGAQAYYDSIMELVASWDVDFVKIDDLSRPYHTKEIEAIRKAIDKTGRPIVLSTSPGATPVGQGPHVMQHANQWRISDDFWDNWTALWEQFQRLHDWTPYRGPGHFPDADMLPLGKIQGGSPSSSGRWTGFTTNEQYTLMSLWAITRSPLIHGGDMTQMDPVTLSLLTNAEVIAVNQQSTHNRQLFRTNNLIVWTADAVGSTNKYLAVFNATGATTNIAVTLFELGYTNASSIRSLWDGVELGSFTGTFSPSLASHRGVLYRLSGPSLPVPWLTDAVAGSNRVSLAWETIATASSYVVKRSTSENGAYVTIAGGVTDSDYTDTTATNGATYFYKVSAIVGGQATPDSQVRSATPVGKPGIVSWNYDRFGTVSDNAIAGVEPVSNWNNSSPANPVSNLADNTGAPTTVDITYTSVNTWSIQGSDPGLDANGASNKRLLNGYLNAGPATWNPPVIASSVTFSEISHDYYDLVVYFSSDVAGREGFVSDGKTTNYFSTLGPASISGANAVFTQTTQTSSNTYPAANYAVFGGLADNSRTVLVQMRDNDEWAGIAGFQIVPRTDPLPATPLSIQPAGNGTTVGITWPPDLGELVLQQSFDLQSWLPADPQPVSNAILVSTAAPKQFFRLARP